MTLTTAQSTQPHIIGVAVEQLFGLYSYRLGSYEAARPPTPNLLILYGDNGSGKTTLLQLVYHLLSPELTKGHRTYLAHTPFQSFQVQLSTGVEVSATRAPGKLRGPYIFALSKHGEPLASWLTTMNEGGGVASPPEIAADRGAYDEAFAALADLGLGLYYLPDDRKAETSGQVSGGLDVDLPHYDMVVTTSGGAKARKLVKRKAHPLLAAIQALEAHIKSEALAAASLGEANISALYADIARRIAARKADAPLSSGVNVIDALQDLEHRCRPYVTYGLIPDLDIAELKSILIATKTQTRRMVEAVLQPYLDSLTARLDALASTKDALSAFIDGINTFYSDKAVAFDLQSGIRITRPDGEKLHPRALSSGEQQLLLLFCNTVRARRRDVLFLIDEPELSLNVKWQRRLLEALLGIVQHSGVQFVISTHSIEILAKHRDSVWRLKPPQE